MLTIYQPTGVRMINSLFKPTLTGDPQTVSIKVGNVELVSIKATPAPVSNINGYKVWKFYDDKNDWHFIRLSPNGDMNAQHVMKRPAPPLGGTPNQITVKDVVTVSVNGGSPVTMSKLSVFNDSAWALDQ